jgi:hypothetical protein
MLKARSRSSFQKVHNKATTSVLSPISLPLSPKDRLKRRGRHFGMALYLSLF